MLYQPSFEHTNMSKHIYLPARTPAPTYEKHIYLPAPTPTPTPTYAYTYTYVRVPAYSAWIHFSL